MLDYNGVGENCTVRHICGCEKQYSTYHYIYDNGPQCDECRRQNASFKYEIGDVFNDMHIVNRRIITDIVTANKLKAKQYNHTVRQYQYVCERCGFDCRNGGYIDGNLIEEYWIREESISNNVQCACCRAAVIVSGINDVATTHPDIVKFFVDKTLSNKYSKGSNKQIAIKCPNCGLIHTSTRSINTLTYAGPPECIQCGDTISYPEKFMYFLLKQLDIDFCFHKTFAWSENVKCINNKLSGKKEYDFYIPQFNAIIETHGIHHYEECSLTQRTLKEEQENDLIKQELAIQNDVLYIVIDCRKSTKQWISQHIINSKLNGLINLDDVDWNKIHDDTLSGLKLRIINDKKSNPQKLISELSQEYGIDVSTIRRWLLSNSDLSCYDPSLNFKNAHIKRSKPVFSPELNFAYRASKFAEEDIGVSKCRIATVINRSGKRPGTHAGIHPITGELLSWEYWTVDQYNSWVKNQDNNFIENNYKMTKGV